MTADNARVRPFNTRTPPRHIKVFHSPAGTPSSGRLGEVHLTKYLTRNAAVDHWGLLVEGVHGGDATFFELNRPEDSDIGVLVRSRTQRQREEGGKKANKLFTQSDAYTFDTWPGIHQVQEEAQAKNEAMGLKYANTGFLTEWTDEEIKTCGEYEELRPKIQLRLQTNSRNSAALQICRENMRGKYHLTEANCQTFVNLLLQRIVTGKDPYVPFGTASHVFGKGPSSERLAGLSKFDQAGHVKLAGSRHTPAPDFAQLRDRHGVRDVILDTVGQNSTRETDEVIDLSWVDAAPRGDIAAVRQSAHFAAGAWARPADPLAGIRSSGSGRRH